MICAAHSSRIASAQFISQFHDRDAGGEMQFSVSGEIAGFL